MKRALRTLWGALGRSWTWLVPLALLLPWNLWAILTDDVPSQPSDSFAIRAGDFAGSLLIDPVEALRALITPDKIPPLPIAIAGSMLLLLGDSFFSLRIGGVACLVVLIWQCHDLSRQAGAGSRVAGWAAFFCGVTPIMFGWARLEYGDIYVAPLFVGCLQIMIRGPLTLRRAVLLGCLGGLAILCKLSFFVLIALPALWFAVRHFKRRGHLLHLLPVIGIALLIGGWWLVLRWNIVVENFSDSTQAWQDYTTRFGGGGLDSKLEQVRLYLWDYPGFPSLWIGAAAGIVLWRHKSTDGAVALLGLGSLGSLAALMLFDPGIRYLLPLGPPCAVLAALALSRVSRGLGKALAAGEIILCSCLYLSFIWLNLTYCDDQFIRFEGMGMIRPVSSFTRACQAVHRARSKTACIYENAIISEWFEGMPNEAGRACNFPVNSPLTRKPCIILVETDNREERYTPLPELRRRCLEMAPLLRLGEEINVRFNLIEPRLLPRFHDRYDYHPEREAQGR